MAVNDKEHWCRSTSPADDMCTKPRGHKSRFHQGKIPGKRHPTKRWTGGINTVAAWEYVDDGYMSEGEWSAYGRFGW